MLSPDVIPRGWLGSKHQLTNSSFLSSFAIAVCDLTVDVLQGFVLFYVRFLQICHALTHTKMFFHDISS